MGLVLSIIVSILSALLLFTAGFNSFALIIIMFFIGLTITKIFGHKGFGGGANDDQQVYVGFVFIALIIMMPFV